MDAAKKEKLLRAARKVVGGLLMPLPLIPISLTGRCRPPASVDSAAGAVIPERSKRCGGGRLRRGGRGALPAFTAARQGSLCRSGILRERVGMEIELYQMDRILRGDPRVEHLHQTREVALAETHARLEQDPDRLWRDLLLDDVGEEIAHLPVIHVELECPQMQAIVGPGEILRRHRSECLLHQQRILDDDLNQMTRGRDRKAAPQEGLSGHHPERGLPPGGITGIPDAMGLKVSEKGVVGSAEQGGGIVVTHKRGR